MADAPQFETRSIPSWMAALARIAIPGAIVAAMGSSLLAWRDLALHGNRLEYLERQVVDVSSATAKFHTLAAQYEARLKSLEAFGPLYGGRFTAADAKDLRAEFLGQVADVRDDLRAHRNEGAHTRADSRMSQLEKEVSECQKQMKELRSGR